MVGVSPFKGRLMDEILDAEYKVVEHQIAPLYLLILVGI
jgi:hypothetical protein